MTIPSPADLDWDLMAWMEACADIEVLAVVVPTAVHGETTVGWQTFTTQATWDDADPLDYVRAAQRANRNIAQMVREAEDDDGGR